MTATVTRSAAAGPATFPGRLPRPTGYWPGLDGLRGLAVLAVVAYHFHVPGFAGGWIGVDVFFVISGFVVTASVLRLVDHAGAPVIDWRFYARRASRLLPALFVLIAFIGTWTYLHDDEITRRVQNSMVAAVLQVYNIAAAFDLTDNRAFAHFWSLSVEWQFYLVVPFAIWALIVAPRRAAAATAALFALFVAALRVVGLASGISATRVYVLTWFRIDGLLLGVAIAFAWQATALRVRQRLYSASWLALAVLAAVPVTVPGWYTWRVPSLALVVPLASLASAVLIYALIVRAAPHPVRWLLELRPLRYVGERSYSIYLWHYVIGVAIIAGGDHGWDGAVTLGRQLFFTTLASLASFAVVERPARRWLNARLRGGARYVWPKP